MIISWKIVIATTLAGLSSVLLVHSQAGIEGPGPYDTRSLCYGVCPIRRIPGTAEGVWWTIVATNSSIGDCGILNNQCPCKCTGFKVCSYFPPPYVPLYNQTTFGYNTEERCYNEQYQYVDRYDRNSPWEVLKLTDKRSGALIIGCILDTDDYDSFFVSYICSVRTPEGEPYVYVASRDIRGLKPEHQRRVDAVLRANNICPEKLIVVNRRNCPRYVS